VTSRPGMKKARTLLLIRPPLYSYNSMRLSSCQLTKNDLIEYGPDRPPQVPDAGLTVADFALDGDALKERDGRGIHEQVPEDGTRAVRTRQAERAQKERPEGRFLILVLSAMVVSPVGKRRYR
jgi:hypothetical protein